RGCGIRGGDEEGTQQDHRHDGDNLTTGQGLQQREELLLRHTLTPDGFTILFLVDGGATEDGEPYSGYTRRNQHHTEDELPDGAATGDTREEHAHEGGPGDPPGPVEDGPATQPLPCGAVRTDGGAAGHLEEGGEVCAQGSGDHIEDGNGGTDHEHEDGQDHRQDHVAVGQVLDALAHAGQGGKDERQGEDGDDPQHGPLARFLNDARRGETCT